MERQKRIQNESQGDLSSLLQLTATPIAAKFAKRDNRVVTEKEMIQRWVNAWKGACPKLEQIRLREVRDADNSQSFEQLASMFNHATSFLPPRASSGLIEMQRYFAKLRK